MYSSRIKVSLADNNHTDVYSEDLYTLLRSSLLMRINDKEPTVRVRAVVALSKLCGSEDPEEVEDGEQITVEVLMDVLSGDPST